MTKRKVKVGMKIVKILLLVNAMPKNIFCKNYIANTCKNHVRSVYPCKLFALGAGSQAEFVRECVLPELPSSVLALFMRSCHFLEGHDRGHRGMHTGSLRLTELSGTIGS